MTMFKIFIVLSSFMSSIITLEQKIYIDQNQSRHVVYTEIGLDKLYNFSVNNSSGEYFTSVISTLHLQNDYFFRASNSPEECSSSVFGC